MCQMICLDDFFIGILTLEVTCYRIHMSGQKVTHFHPEDKIKVLMKIINKQISEAQT